MRHDDAGTELFILATNFLLYIALVILTILMQRVYFPHTLEVTPESVTLDDEDDEATAAVSLCFPRRPTQ